LPKRLYFWLQPAAQSLTAALLFTCGATVAAQAVDTADEVPAISRAVAALIKTRHFYEAEALANKGLALCDTAPGAKGLCVGQFNDSLGDIAYLQKDYSTSLTFFQKAVEAREGIVDSESALIFASQVRLGRTYLALNRIDEAEPLLKKAIAGLNRATPLSSNLGIALESLRRLYAASGRIDEEVGVQRSELEFHEKAEGGNVQRIQRWRLSLHDALVRQAKSRSARKNEVDAERALLESIKLIDPPPPGAEKYLSVSLEELGILYDRQRRFAEAEPLLLRALEYREKLAGPSDSNLPVALLGLATIYQNWGKRETSLQYALRAVAKFDEAKIQDLKLAVALLKLGQAHNALGQNAEAERSLLRAHDLLDHVVPENEPLRIKVRLDLGALQLSQENYAEAERSFQSALELEQKYPNSNTYWRSETLAWLGAVYRDKARYEEAERVLSEAVKLEEMAGDTRKSLLAPRLSQLGSIYRRQNRYAEAESTYLRALKLEQSDLDRATALNSLGLIYNITARYDLAEPLLKEALDIRTRGLPANSNLVLETILNLSSIDSSRGNFTEAEAKLRGTLKIAETLGSAHSTTIALHSAFLAEVLISEGKLDEADALVRRSIELNQQRLGADNPRFGGALKALASIEALRGRDRDAEEHYRQALAIDEKAVGPNSSAVADDLVNLAPLLKRAGKFQDAKDALERALAIKVAQFGADSPMTTGAILGLASGAYEVGNYVDARNLADRARQIHERTFGPEHYALVGRWIFSARLYIVEGKLDDAGTCLNQAAQIVAKILSSDHPSNIDVLGAKADLARARGEQVDAEQYLRGALSVAEKLFEPDYPVRRAATDRLTGQLWAQGKFADAEHLQREELSNVELKRGFDHPSTAIAARGLAAILGSSGRQNEAAALYRRALAVDERAFGPQSDQAAWDHFGLGSLFRRMGLFEGAQTQINLARTAWESQGRLLAANSALEQLALLSSDRGSPAEGVIYLEKMLNIAEQAVGNDSPALVPILAQLGRFYAIAERHEAAEKILVRITGLIGHSPPEQTPGYLNVLQLQAELNAERGDVAAAEEVFNRAIAIATKYSGAHASAVGISSFNLATVYLKAGRFQDAIRSFAKALDIFKRESGDRAPIVGYTLMGAAQAYAKIGDELSSKALLATAVEILGPTFAAQRPPPRWL
jgi:tetratricopeptide (TPR) repeat protein